MLPKSGVSKEIDSHAEGRLEHFDRSAVSILFEPSSFGGQWQVRVFISNICGSNRKIERLFTLAFLVMVIFNGFTVSKEY